MSEEPDNVVHLRFKRTKEDLPTPPVKKHDKKKSPPYCGLHFFVYDLDEREVSCSRCGRKFDALEALDHLGRKWSEYDYTHRNARKEIEELKKEREQLAKQVTNLKARRRRLVPNVQKDIERARSELWRVMREKNHTIAVQKMGGIQVHLNSAINTLSAFGNEPEPA